jgi:hypothetical protein
MANDSKVAQLGGQPRAWSIATVMQQAFSLMAPQLGMADSDGDGLPDSAAETQQLLGILLAQGAGDLTPTEVRAFVRPDANESNWKKGVCPARRRDTGLGTQAPKVCVLVEDVVLDGPAGYGANDAADHGVQGGDVGFAAVHCVPDSTTSEYAGVDFVEASCHGCNHEQRATNGPGVRSREQDNHEECRANRCGTECEHVTAQDAEGPCHCREGNERAGNLSQDICNRVVLRHLVRHEIPDTHRRVEVTSGYGSHDVHEDHEGSTEGKRSAETPTKRAESSEAYENQEKGSHDFSTDGLHVRVFKHGLHQRWGVEWTI